MEEKLQGIPCPECRGASQVIDSRPTMGGSAIRRRRKCLNAACAHRFTTYETPATTPPVRAMGFGAGLVASAVGAALDVVTEG